MLFVIIITVVSTQGKLDCFLAAIKCFYNRAKRASRPSKLGQDRTSEDFKGYARSLTRIHAIAILGALNTVAGDREVGVSQKWTLSLLLWYNL